MFVSLNEIIRFLLFVPSSSFRPIRMSKVEDIETAEGADKNCHCNQGLASRFICSKKKRVRSREQLEQSDTHIEVPPSGGITMCSQCPQYSLR